MPKGIAKAGFRKPRCDKGVVRGKYGPRTASTATTVTSSPRTIHVQRKNGDYTDGYMSYKEIRALFKRNGKYIKLGNGAFGTVYVNRKHPDVVYKVGSISRNGAYLDFLKVAMANQNNPFYPKIYSLKMYKDRYGNDTFFVVKMENLERLGDLPKKYYTSFTEELRTKFCLKEQIEMARAMQSPLVQHMVEVQGHLRNLFIEHTNDCHNGNFMLRGAQLVITDPVS